MTSSNSGRPINTEELANLALDPSGWQHNTPLCLELNANTHPPDAATQNWLRQTPAPIIGIGDPTHPIASACDLFVPSANEAAPLVHAAETNPLAAMVLVQLLRTTEFLPPADALTLESMAYATLQAGPEFKNWLANHATPPNPETAEKLRLERTDGDLTLTLNHPTSHNAIDTILRDALVEVLEMAACDPSLTRVHLTATGKAFSIGGALWEFGQAPDPATAHRIRSLRLPARAALRVAPKFSAHVQGACIGAGLEIAAFATRLTATPRAFFQLPELRMGLIPGAGGCVSLPRRIGRQRTAWLILSGRRITAQTALDWGLIDAIQP